MHINVIIIRRKSGTPVGSSPKNLELLRLLVKVNVLIIFFLVQPVQD